MCILLCLCYTKSHYTQQQPSHQLLTIALCLLLVDDNILPVPLVCRPLLQREDSAPLLFRTVGPHEEEEGAALRALLEIPVPLLIVQAAGVLDRLGPVQQLQKAILAKADVNPHQ